MENLSKEQLLELAEAYEELIIEVVADLTDGETYNTINYRIYKRMQGIMLEYFGEVM